MQLLDFPTWKTEAAAYWSAALTASQNGFYSAIINSPTLSGYAGPAKYENEAAMLASINSQLDTTEGYWNTYKTTPTLENKMRDALISLYSYVTMKDVNLATNAPLVLEVSIAASANFRMTSYTLPEYSTVFTFITETVSGYDGHTINTNTDLLNNKLWYYGTSAETPSPTGTYITDRGVVTKNSLTTVDTMITTGATADIAAIDVMTAAIPSSTRDNILFRVYGKPPITISPTDTKTFILVNYGYQELLDGFGWQIRGVNVP